MAKELVRDAMNKVAAVQHLRDDLAWHMQFQYGSIMYEMKHRHKQMFKLYAEVVNLMDTSSPEGNATVNEDDYPVCKYYFLNHTLNAN